MVTCWGGLDTKGTGFGEKRWGWSSDPTCPPSQEVSMGSKQMRKVPVAFPTSHRRGKLKRSYEKRGGLLLDLGFWDSPSNNPESWSWLWSLDFTSQCLAFLPTHSVYLLPPPSPWPLSPTPRRVTSLMFSMHASSLGKEKADANWIHK